MGAEEFVLRQKVAPSVGATGDAVVPLPRRDQSGALGFDEIKFDLAHDTVETLLNRAVERLGIPASSCAVRFVGDGSRVARVLPLRRLLRVHWRLVAEDTNTEYVPAMHVIAPESSISDDIQDAVHTSPGWRAATFTSTELPGQPSKSFVRAQEAGTKSGGTAAAPDGEMIAYQQLRSRLVGMAASEHSLTTNHFTEMVRLVSLQHMDKSGNRSQESAGSLRDSSEISTESDVRLAQRWLEWLQAEGVLYHRPLSRDDALRSTLFLVHDATPLMQPQLPSDIGTLEQSDGSQSQSLHSLLTSALDVEGHSLHAKIESKRDDQRTLVSQLQAMDALDDELQRKAAKQLWYRAVGTGGFLLAQYAFIFQQVYVTSWDVMEPICYFLSTSYSVLFFGFFLATKLEPQHGNIWQYFLARRRSRLQASVENPEWRSLEAFETERADLQRRVMTLRTEEQLLDAREQGAIRASEAIRAAERQLATGELA